MIKVLGIHKPVLQVETATAYLSVKGGTSRDSVIEAGLKALGETRGSVYGYGVRASDGREIRSAAIWDQEVTVYAYRD